MQTQVLTRFGTSLTSSGNSR